MKKSLVVVVSVTLLVLIVSGLSYSYFKTNGISKEEHLSVVAKKLAVIFTDDSELTGEIYPDYYDSKTFSVENKSESLYKYDIIFEGLVNTFVTSGFLQYKITSEDGGYNMTEFEDIPKSDTPTDTILAYSVEIEDGVKHNYKLEIRYQNSETENQSADMGKVLSGNIAIKEGTKNPKLKQVTLNVENGTPKTSITEVLEGNDATFEVEPNEGYKTKGTTLTCDNEYSKIINEETTSITIPNILTDTICTLRMKSSVPNFIAKLKADNPTRNTRDASSFNTPFTTAGLYVESDSKYLETEGKEPSINEVLYFAGPVQNNWVVFGNFWWRIIRTNEDGSVRLLYAGKATKDADGKYTGHDQANGIIDNGKSVKYNSSYDNTMYVGYMYGSTGSLKQNRADQKNHPSTIKEVVDTWYDTNMAKNDEQSHLFSSYISRTAVYCNDRATSSYSPSSTMFYAAYRRLVDSKRPSFKCGNNEKGELYTGEIGGTDVADRFTGSNESNVGNQLLGDKPIALMTADEVAYAGGIYAENNSNVWYYQNSKGDSITGSMHWWTMSPYYFYYGVSALVFFVLGSGGSPGYLSFTGVNYSNAVRPVVSLKSCVEVTGTGKTDDPYIPSIDDACAAVDN